MKKWEEGTYDPFKKYKNPNFPDEPQLEKQKVIECNICIRHLTQNFKMLCENEKCMYCISICKDCFDFLESKCPKCRHSVTYVNEDEVI